MYVLSSWFLFPIINALVTVQIHQNSLYSPRDSCAFIRNASLSTDPSIQSCIWECVYEYNCQTAVYFKDINICSMFAEFWETGSIASSEHVSASVICYRRSHEPIITCPSTVTSTPEHEDVTTMSIVTTSTRQTSTVPETITTTISSSTNTTSTTASVTADNSETSTSASNTSPTTTNPCVLGSLRWNTTGITVLGSSLAIETSGVYVDVDNTLYAVDENINYVVWKLLNNASNATTIAGTFGLGGSNSFQLNYPNDVYVDRNGNLYVSDCYNHRIQKYSSGSTNGATIAGINGGAGSSLNQLNTARYFAFDSTDTYMYIADYDNYRVMRYSTNSTSGTNGTLVAGGNGLGNTNTQLNEPWGIHYLPSVSNDLYITNFAGHSVIRWTPGATSGVFVAGTPGEAGFNSTLLNGPVGIKIDSYLNMYVADNGNNRVQMFCANNQTGTTIAGTGAQGNSATQLYGPRGIAFDTEMNMYIGDSYNHRVQKFMKL